MEIWCRSVLSDWTCHDLEPEPGNGFVPSVGSENKLARIEECVSLNHDGDKLKYVIVWKPCDKPAFRLTKFARIGGRDRVDLRQFVDKFYFEARNWLAEREVLADELDGDEVIRVLERVIPEELLKPKVASALFVVNHLIAICQGHETDEWVARFIAVRDALASNDLRRAIREEARLSTWQPPMNFASRLMAQRLGEAMAVVCRQLHYPGHTEPVVQFTDLPQSVLELGPDLGSIEVGEDDTEFSDGFSFVGREGIE